MTTTVILNGNSYNDGSTPPGNMGDGGHTQNFMKCLSDTLVEIQHQVTGAAQRFQGTTTTSVSIAAATVTVVTQTGLSFVAGQLCTVYSAATPTMSVSGPVLAYDSGAGTLSLKVVRRSGVGSFTDGVVSPGSVGPDGVQGVQGIQGPQGIPGIDGSVGLAMQFDASSQADGNPGAGKLRLNNAAQSSATTAYVNNQSALGAAIQAWVDTWDDSTNPVVKGSLSIRAKNDPAKFLEFQVTGAVVSGAGYRKVPLTYVAGSATSPFADTDALSILFVRAGDIGLTGPGSTIQAQRAGITITSAPRGYANFGPEFSVSDDGAGPNSFTVTIPRAWTDLASAAMTDIGAIPTEDLRITGTTTIISLGTASSGTIRTIRFSGTLTLTYNATSLILPGSASIVTAPNDIAEFRSLGAGNWICTSYQRADGSALATRSGATTTVPLTAAISLSWTSSALQVFAPDQSTGRAFRLPDATDPRATLGSSFVFRNEDRFSFGEIVNFSSGRTIAFVPPGAEVQVRLTSNSTADGAWKPTSTFSSNVSGLFARLAAIVPQSSTASLWCAQLSRTTGVFVYGVYESADTGYFIRAVGYELQGTSIRLGSPTNVQGLGMSSPPYVSVCAVNATRALVAYGTNYYTNGAFTIDLNPSTLSVTANAAINPWNTSYGAFFAGLDVEPWDINNNTFLVAGPNNSGKICFSVLTLTPASGALSAGPEFSITASAGYMHISPLSPTLAHIAFSTDAGASVSRITRADGAATTLTVGAPISLKTASSVLAAGTIDSARSALVSYSGATAYAGIVSDNGSTVAYSGETIIAKDGSLSNSGYTKLPKGRFAILAQSPGASIQPVWVDATSARSTTPTQFDQRQSSFNLLARAKLSDSVGAIPITLTLNSSTTIGATCIAFPDMCPIT